MTVEYRAPRNNAELDDTIRCSERAFGGGGEFFASIVRNDPWFRLQNTRACFLDGKAVSVVQIFDRPMRIGTGVVRMGGLGSVGTDPDYRRAGYSHGVLRDTVRYLREEGYDLSILFTGVPTHYARAGWVIQPAYTMRLTLPERIPDPGDPWDILPCELDRDLPALQTIYDAFNASRTGTLVRTRTYWLNQPRWRTYEYDLFRVARRNGAVRAYLKAGHWDLREFGCLPGDEPALKTLLLRFFQQARTGGAAEVDAPAPREYQGLFESLGCTVRRRETSSAMVRIFRLESLLESLLPLFQARLDASGRPDWNGEIRIRYEAGEAAMVVRNGNLAVSRPGPEPEVDLPVSQTQLLGLLFGTLRPEHVAFSNGLSIPGRKRALLDALFPPGEPFLWRTDGF